MRFPQVGDEGAGHFVKMVHNGIEYGDMQLICEAYHVMRTIVGLSNDEISQVCDQITCSCGARSGENTRPHYPCLHLASKVAY